jgi:hypothetical protein
MKLDEKYFEELVAKVLHCVGWNETEKLLKQIARDAAAQQREKCSNPCTRHHSYKNNCAGCDSKLDIK